MTEVFIVAMQDGGNASLGSGEAYSSWENAKAVVDEAHKEGRTYMKLFTLDIGFTVRCFYEEDKQSLAFIPNRISVNGKPTEEEVTAYLSRRAYHFKRWEPLKKPE